MLNRVVLAGRLVKDPELRTANSGNSITSFTLAVDSTQKNPDGTRGTCFIDCVAFRQSAETICKFARKGHMVGVDGKLNQRKYQRPDGSMASVIEILCDSITLLTPKGNVAGHDEIPPFDDAPAPTEAEENRNLESIDLPDDDLPF